MSTSASPYAQQNTGYEYVWTLIGTDGQNFIVDAQCMLGRNPDTTGPGIEGTLALPVRDEGLSISKSHALLGLDDEGLWVMDWESRNGTYVAPANEEWERLEPAQAYRLMDGDTIRFGRLEFHVRYQRESVLEQQLGG